ncbi:MAG: hypothetical protein WBB37_09540 [bacterium]
MFTKKRYLLFGLVIILAFVILSCAPGNERWDQEINPGHDAGFWAGIWHGLIVVITFVISLFTREVDIYEVSNTGWLYNLGYLIGLMISLGGMFRHTRRQYRLKKEDWNKFGNRIEERVRKGIKSWLDEADKDKKDKEWEEIAIKIEEKIKEALKEWAE